jgi:hypothetical protein
MAIKVIFEYDEESRKWDPTVHDASSETEARQAFNAVVLTCRQLDPRLLNLSEVEALDNNGYRIYPAVKE